MRVSLVYPQSPFDINLPYMSQILSKWYEEAIEVKIGERKEKFGIEDLNTSPAWGFRVIPSIAYVSAISKGMGMKPSLLHLDYLRSRKAENAQKESRKEIEKEAANSDVAIIFNSTIQFNEAVRMSRIMKSSNEECLTISLGREATFLTEKVLKDGFDIAIKGEAESVLPKILNIIDEGKPHKLARIKGIGIKIGNKILVSEGINKAKVESLPLPDFQIFPKEMRKNANVSWWISRGCPFKCAYCYEHAFWNPLRVKSEEKIQAEMKELKKCFPFNNIFFHDSTFNAIKNWKVILKEIEECHNLYCSLNLRLDMLAKSDLEFLSSANVVAVFGGIETFSEGILVRLGRRQKRATILKKACKVNKAIPFLTLSTIIGLPGESIENVQSLKNLIKRLLQKNKIFQVTTRIFVPYPGTSIFSSPEKFDVEILTNNFERYDRYSFPPVYRLKSLDEFEIYSLFLDVYSLIVKSNLEEVGLDIKKWEDNLFTECNERSKNIYKLKYG